MRLKKICRKLFIGVLAGVLVISMASCGNGGKGDGGNVSSSAEETAGSTGQETVSGESTTGGSASGETTGQGGEIAALDDGLTLPVMETTFDSMIWGKYTYDEWITEERTNSENKPYTYYRLDTEKILDKMALQNVTFEYWDGEVYTMDRSVLPFEITYAGPLGGSKIYYDYFSQGEEYWEGLFPFQSLWVGGNVWEADGLWGTEYNMEELYTSFVDFYGNEDYWNEYQENFWENLIEMKFCNPDGERVGCNFLYEIEDNKILLYEWEMDKQTFAIKKEKFGEMEFAFEGRNLLLKNQGCIRKYAPEDFSQESQNYYKSHPLFAGYVAKGENACEGIVRIMGGWGENTNSVIFADSGRAEDPIIFSYTEDEISIQWNQRRIKGDLEDGGSFTAQYIYCDNFGMILIKDGKYYCFQSTYDQYYGNKLEELMGDDVSLEDVSEKQIAELIQKQQMILKNLQEAFQDAGINADIDPNSGKVTLDSSILFAVNDASLSAEGKDYLNRFLEVYEAVLSDEEYASSISSILVEGHTDTDGSYDYNMELSEKRAESVVSYCLEYDPALQNHISSKGCSYEEPIYDDNGKVDKAASRRVVFKFRLKVE